MFNWIKNTEATVETILSGWTKTIKDLEAHAEAKAAEAIENNALVTFYEEATNLAKAEVAKAKDVAAKIKALFA
ncbi:hypothetical protein [Bradyrhizobium erythrophlei]|uniref:Uncharacterized protein n=1 Tax=Bradyrhizobium erythrophlei TaxID=1437360 RepID=A0A1M5TB21_9BRAD|nr:hypothetical protein [Bradyrhizobium erythrophlei]SHH47985.1 hypothetical protein SAMN05444169_7658 [Bradyrhizobium erythrophlei]